MAADRTTDSCAHEVCVVVVVVAQEHPPDSPRAFLTAALRLLVGDHALLLAFLATGWPVGSLSNIFVQFVR